jgi:hypothetical protein
MAGLTKHGYPDGRRHNGAPFKPLEQRAPSQRGRICVWLSEAEWFEVEYEAGRRRMSVSALLRWSWDLARPALAALPTVDRE